MWKETLQNLFPLTPLFTETWKKHLICLIWSFKNIILDLSANIQQQLTKNFYFSWLYWQSVDCLFLKLYWIIESRLQWKAVIPQIFNMFCPFFRWVLVQIIIKFKKERERKEADKTEISSAERNRQESEDLTSPFMDNINFFNFKLPDASAEGLQIMEFHCSYAVCSVPAEILCKVPGFNFGERSLLFHRKASLILGLFRTRFDFFNGTSYSFKEIWSYSFFIRGFPVDIHSICFLLF